VIAARVYPDCWSAKVFGVGDIRSAHILIPGGEQYAKRIQATAG